jgi:hypothetical protein
MTRTIFTRTAARLPAALTAAALAASAPALAAQGGDPADKGMGVDTGADPLTAEQITSFTAEQRDEALAAAEDMVAAIDEKLEEQERALRRNWNAMSEEVRDQAEETAADLRAARNEVASWYGSLKYGTKEAWGEITEGFSDAYADFENLWDDSDAGSA